MKSKNIGLLLTIMFIAGCMDIVEAQQLKFNPASSTSSFPTQKYEYKWTINPNKDTFGLEVTRLDLYYKTWTLLGEPVFDFKAAWSANIAGMTNYVYVPEKFGKKHDIHGRVDITDKALQKKLSEIKPLNIYFYMGLQLKSKGIAYEARETELRKFKRFSVDLPQRMGVVSDFSVPSSPSWKQLHPDWTKLYKDRKSESDIIVHSLWPEIEWPQYYLESIVIEQLNLNKKVVRMDESKAKGDDFWDTPVSKPDVPAQAGGKPNLDERKVSEAARAEQERLKALQSTVGNLATVVSPELNKLQIELPAILTATEFLVYDAKGKIINRVPITASSNRYTLASQPGTARIDIVKNGEVMGTMPWAHIKPGQALIQISDFNGQWYKTYYSHQLIVYWKGITVGTINVGTKDAKLYLPDAFKEENISELRFSTKGAASHATIIHNSQVDYYRERDKGSSGIVFPHGEQGLQYLIAIDLAGKSWEARFSMTKFMPHRPENYHTFSEFDQVQLKFYNK